MPDIYYPEKAVELEEDVFGTFNSKTVKRFTWRNSHAISVQVITYGATITSMKIPNKNGTIDDIVLGFNDMKG